MSKKNAVKSESVTVTLPYTKLVQAHHQCEDASVFRGAVHFRKDAFLTLPESVTITFNGGTLNPVKVTAENEAARLARENAELRALLAKSARKSAPKSDKSVPATDAPESVPVSESV